MEQLSQNTKLTYLLTKCRRYTRVCQTCIRVKLNQHIYDNIVHNSLDYNINVYDIDCAIQKLNKMRDDVRDSVVFRSHNNANA